MPPLPPLLLLAAVNPPSWLFPAIFLLVGAMLVYQKFLFQYVYDVRLGAAAVEIIIFKRLVILSIPYEEIVGVERVSFVQAIFSFALGLVNRPFGEYFLLRRTRGIFRRILVTPNRSDEFYNTLMKQLVHLPTEKSRS